MRDTRYVKENNLPGNFSYKHSIAWLCQQHAFEKIRHWVNSLTCVYFFRAFGGHANDPDYFGTDVIFDDVRDLNQIFRVAEIPPFPVTESHAHVMVDGHRWFVAVDHEKKRLRLSTGGYDVTDQDFEAALSMSRKLDNNGLAGKIDRSAIFLSTCVSLERYPELRKQ